MSGSIVQTGSTITLDALVLGVPSGEQFARGSVVGDVSDPLTLVDRLSLQLSAALGGGPPDRLSNILSRSPEAVRAYLQGWHHFRRGEMSAAAVDFDAALAADSSFALAAIGLRSAGNDLPNVENDPHRRGSELSWSLRTRLPERDRAVVELRGDPTLPGHPQVQSPETFGIHPLRGARSHLKLSEAAAELNPDRAESWTRLGRALMVAGPAAEAPSWKERARSSFRPGAAARLDERGPFGQRNRVRNPARTCRHGPVASLGGSVRGHLALAAWPVDLERGRNLERRGREERAQGSVREGNDAQHPALRCCDDGFAYGRTRRGGAPSIGRGGNPTQRSRVSRRLFQAALVRGGSERRLNTRRQLAILPSDISCTGAC